MLSEGVYELDYHAAIANPAEIGSGLAMIRDGKILATDRCGSVFMGSYDDDTCSAQGHVTVRLRFGPGELVTGRAFDENGAEFEIVTMVAGRDKLEATIDVAGEFVKVRLTYIGPLPG